LDLKIRAKNLKVTPTVRDYIDKKVGRIIRHLPLAGQVNVELTSQNVRAQGQRVVAQLTLDINGVMLRGEERGRNVMAAIDAAVDVLDRRIDRYKGKSSRIERSRRAVRRGQGLKDRIVEEVVQEASATEEPGMQEAVVKYKTFPVKPMAVDEAIFQMELLGHSFFLFLNSDADTYNVLYRRRDGAYGLIEPESL